MKNARPQQVETSAKDQGDFNGNLPKRVNTVTAGVLAALLEGQVLTGMEAVFRQSTTRAAAHVHYLGKYGWHIKRRDIATGTKDGRVAWVTIYWLSAQSRKAALAVGARLWIDDVKAAASKRRTQAEAVKVRAAHINTAARLGLERFSAGLPMEGYHHE